MQRREGCIDARVQVEEPRLGACSMRMLNRSAAGMVLLTLTLVLGFSVLGMRTAGSRSEPSATLGHVELASYHWLYRRLVIHGHLGPADIKIAPDGEANCVGAVTSETFPMRPDEDKTVQVGIQINDGGSCSREASGQRFSVRMDFVGGQMRGGATVFPLQLRQFFVGEPYYFYVGHEKVRTPFFFPVTTRITVSGAYDGARFYAVDGRDDGVVTLQGHLPR